MCHRESIQHAYAQNEEHTCACVYLFHRGRKNLNLADTYSRDLSLLSSLISHGCLYILLAVFKRVGKHARFLIDVAITAAAYIELCLQNEVTANGCTLAVLA